MPNYFQVRNYDGFHPAWPVDNNLFISKESLREYYRDKLTETDYYGRVKPIMIMDKKPETSGFYIEEVTVNE